MRRAWTVLALTGLLLGAASTTPTPATAAEERYVPPASGSWTVDGRGWGHGIGMSQWGAQGAALQGLTATQILAFYYPGTTQGTVTNRVVRVRLNALAGRSQATVTAPAGQSGFTLQPVGGGTSRQVSARHLTVTRSTSGYRFQARTTPGGAVTSTVTVAADQVNVTTGDGVQVGPTLGGDWTWYRGTLRLTPPETGTSTSTFDVVNDVALETYLRGVVPNEVPAGWHTEALKAQSVAARSYVLSTLNERRYSDTCDTTACQVYRGRSRSVGGQVTSSEHSRTDAAITGTARQVRLHNGAVAFTQYSSTNGGFSRAGSRPYLVAKADPYTGTATGDTRTSWTEQLSVSTVARHCPGSGGTLRALVVTARDGNGELGGRITGARVECSTGNANITGNTNLAFGLLSHWWRPRAAAPTPTPTPTTPPARTAEYHLTNSWGPSADHVFRYGTMQDTPLPGDWDGNGRDTLTLRDGARFHITTNLGGPAARVLTYGRVGDVVLVGDWNGDGNDTLAVRRGREYHIKNSISDGAADVVVRYGRPDDVVLVGDWNGDGNDTLAVRRGREYHIKNSISDGAADVVVRYGRPDDVVLVGDWNGDGNDTLTVRRGNRYHVRNSLTDGVADLIQPYGRVDDEVFSGDWNGDGRDTLGIRRPV
ncbi:SpoIID/LytB domain-containing protein [Cellulomonas bogoriensis]|uniref:Sporulation stage II protein D amidase enhancer LytB N-terminal domain-containing protein n=1 Tax=Cellulomonas bogoriensis 69B4 = DSM 16987 TaxID=1386082 RepID=A0A0A0BUC8_9CELL|nr:SpoIID/LytB domain-containing protein [Cellulomonas bogoriensis]KGM12023.1 hypothetical protein N869_02135 [Cellulomonas bogoriensis 69B4 = DSM 16987]